MDTGPSSDNRYLANETPVVLNWKDGEDASDMFLRPSRPVTLLLGLNVAKKTAIFRIRVPFQVNQSHGFIFIFINPSDVHCVKAQSHTTTTPEPVRQSLIGKGSSHGVVGLKIELKKTPTIVGPVNTTRLYPGGKPGGNLLACLRSLSKILTLTVFIADESLLMDQIPILCAEMLDSRLQPNVRDYALGTLYEGRGGKDIGGLLAPFVLRSAHDTGTNVADNSEDVVGFGVTGEPPPTYDQVQSQSQSLPPVLADSSGCRKKRRASRDNLASPSPKKFSFDSSPPPSELAQLRVELDQLRRQLCHYTPATDVGSPTEDGSLIDRFDSIEQRLCALEAGMKDNSAESVGEQVRERLLEDLLPRLLDFVLPHINKRLDNCTHDWVAELVEKAVDDRIDDVEGDLAEFRDDIELSVRDKLAEAVGMDLPDVVSQQLEDVVAEKLKEVVPNLLEKANISLEIPR